MKHVYFVLTVAVVIGAGCSSTKYKRGDLAYSNMAYEQATRYYAAYLKKHNDPQAMMKLGDTYHQMRNYAAAEYWYEKSLTGRESSPEEKLKYATVLKMNGKYDKAKEWFTAYLTQVPNDQLAAAQLNSCDSINSYYRYSKLYNVAPVEAFGNVSNFSMIPYEDGFVFNSEIPVRNKPKTNPWNGRPYLNIMYAKLENEQLKSPVSFSTSLNSPYHNGPVAFTPDYKRIYYSRSNESRNHLSKDKDGVANIKIYTAERNGTEWTNIKELPFDNPSYSCGHPTLSEDGNTMYFISDMPGTLGKTDIYMSKLENGQWSAPVNLGSNVNTPGYEMFPYYYKDPSGPARLYYSSDGLAGMGGLDMYFIEQQPDGSWSTPVHLGAPFNSSKDDFGLTLKNNAAMGYFSSSRDGNGDIDKLYQFNKDQLKFMVEGVVLNKANKLPIGHARVQMNNLTNKNNYILYADNDGRFSSPLEVNSDYEFVASKKDFMPARTGASTIGRESDEVIKVTIYLDGVQDILSLTNIHYDFDKSEIRPDAAVELDRLVDIMKANPDLQIALDSHADCRGSDDYNIKLTERRAKSVITYLASKGITPLRLNASWYGERKPVNECVDGVPCTTAKYQENRRTEFKAVTGSGTNTFSAK